MASKISGSPGSGGGGGGGGGGSTVLSRSLAKVQSLFDEAQNLTARPPLASLASIAIGGIGRVLFDLGVMEALPPKVAYILAEGGVVVEEEIGEGGDGRDDGGDEGGDDLPSFGEGCGSSSGSTRSSSPKTFIGGRMGMLAALKASACNSKCSDGMKL